MAVKVATVDCTSATNYPVFTVGTNLVTSLGLSDTDLQDQGYTLEGSGLAAGTGDPYSDTFTMTWYQFDVEVTVLYAVYVTHWKFRHCDPANPYDAASYGETHSPSWINNNISPF